MKSFIEENEKKIEKLDINYYLKNNNYQMASALAALAVTNEIQKAYIKPEDNLESGDYALRLYALLQGLFVSIDSLYAIAYALTKSKSFININNNPDLRALKYIRNDVVGHPSNRVLSSDELAYCILDEKSISKEKFSYNIYSKDNVEVRVIYVDDILKSYYKESNALLDVLFNIATTSRNNSVLQNSISNVLSKFYESGDYKKALEDFINLYKEQYPDSSKNQHRILWRYELIHRLYDLNYADADACDVINHCIALELTKIYELLFNCEYDIGVNRKTPKYISSFYRFVNKNKDLIPLLEYLKDSDNPNFNRAIVKLYNRVVEKKIVGAKAYLALIIDAYKKNDLDMIYALALPIKEYKKK